MSGWIKLHRKITEHWIWEDPEKLKWWLDLIMMANHQPRDILINDEIIEIDTGERHTSEVKLAERWKTTRGKVRRFLNLLEKDEMIKISKSRQKGTTYKVLNYSNYQAKKESDEHRMNIERTSNEQRMNIKRTSNEHKQELKELEELKELKEAVASEQVQNSKAVEKTQDKNISSNPLLFYEKNFGMLSPFIREDIIKWYQEEEMEPQAIVYALELALEREKTYNYAKGILNSWWKKDIRTRKDAEAESIGRQKRQENSFNRKIAKDETLPDWAIKSDNTIKDELVSDDESKDLDDRLERLRKMREEQFQQ